MSESVSIFAAFGGGLLSFVSPCVLPMAPVYLAIICGPGIYKSTTRKRTPVLLHSLAFVAGFTLVFTALGALAGLTGFAVNLATDLLNTIAGSLLVVFGLFMLAAMAIPALNFEKRFSTPLGGTTGYLRSFLVGAAFTLAWTACVGPILGGILALASVHATAWQGAYLLAVYSLGLGLPFLVIGLAFDTVRPILSRIARYSRVFYILGGVLLLGMGILVLTGNLERISRILA